MILNPTVDSHAKAQGRRARNDSGTVSILVVKGSPIKQVRVTEFPRKHPETPRTLPRAEARAERAEALIELQKKVATLFGESLPATDEQP